jgi:predicted amino acid racemase
MAGPVIEVDIDKIEKNARTLVSLCADHGIGVTGVTKVTCGMPQVAQAMIRGGVTQIGESRLENIHRLRAGGVNRPVMLLRIPPLSAAEEIVRSVDVSLNSEISVIRRLGQIAESLGTIHRVILMVDLGDLREGIWPEDLLPTVREVLDLPGIKIQGLGTNLTCYGGVIPTEENLQQLVDYAHRVEDRFGIALETLSGGNSSTLPLLARGRVPREINNLRLGESILLGRETLGRSAWPGTSQEGFCLRAELIELKKKPSVPIGEIGQDAFGHTPVFEDRGAMVRGILNIGREDVDVEGLTPVDPDVKILGASSDHLLVDLTARAEKAELGQEIRFIPGYSALLAGMTSAYVSKQVIMPPHLEEQNQRRVALVGSLFASEKYGEELTGWLDRLEYKYEKFGDGTSADEIGRLIHPGKVPVLGGRQFTSRGVAAASRAMGSFGLIWVDSTVTHEELLRVLARENESVSASLSLDNIVLLGPREIEPEAARLIRRDNITVYTMEEISLLPLREIIRQALNKSCGGTQGLYLKFAGRVADNGNDGLTNRETHLIMEMVAASRTLRVLELDDDETPGVEDRFIRSSREASANMPRFLLSALGKRILGQGGS